MTFMSRKTAPDARPKVTASGSVTVSTPQAHSRRVDSAWTMTSLRRKKDQRNGMATGERVTVTDSFEKAPNPMDKAPTLPTPQRQIPKAQSSPVAAVFESELVELPSAPRITSNHLPKVRLVPPAEDTTDTHTLYSASTSPAPSPGMEASRSRGGRFVPVKGAAAQSGGRRSSSLARASMSSLGPMAVSSASQSGARSRSRPPSIAPSRSGSKDQWMGMSGQFNYPPPTFNRTNGFPGVPIVMPKTKREVQVEMRRRSIDSLASADTERRRRSAAAARCASGPVMPATTISKTLPELPPGFAASRAAAASQNKAAESPSLRRPPSLNLLACKAGDVPLAPFTVVPLNDATPKTPLAWQPEESRPESPASATPPATPRAQRPFARTKSASPPKNKSLPAPPVVRKQRSLRAFFFGRKVTRDEITSDEEDKQGNRKDGKPALQITVPFKSSEPEQPSSNSSRTYFTSQDDSPHEPEGRRSASQTPKTSSTRRPGFFALHKRHLSLSNLAALRKSQAAEAQRPPLPARAASDLSLLKVQAKGAFDDDTAAPALKKPETVSPILPAVPFLDVPQMSPANEDQPPAGDSPAVAGANDPPKQYLAATATVSPFSLALTTIPDALSVPEDVEPKPGLSPSATHHSLRSSTSRDTASRSSERWSEEGHSMVDEEQCELAAATSRRLSREIFAQPSIFSIFTRPSRAFLRAPRDRSSLRPTPTLIPSHPSISSLASSASANSEVAANTSIMRAMLTQILPVSSSGINDGPDGQAPRMARASTVTLAPMRKPLLIDLPQVTLTRRSKAAARDTDTDATPTSHTAAAVVQTQQEGDSHRDEVEDEVAASDESVITDLTTTSSSEGHSSLETPTATSALNPLIVASASESDEESSEDHALTHAKVQDEDGRPCPFTT